MEYIEIEGQKYEIQGRDHNGTPVIKGHATSVHQKDEQGNHIYDEDGNPKISVHISVSPVAQAAVEPAEQE